MVDQARLWDARTAAEYDTPGEGMFAPEVLGPTVERLAELAAGGHALELAIGTGRVAIGLREVGIDVTGIELSVPDLRSLTPGTGGTLEHSEPGYLLVDTYDTLAQILISHHVHFDSPVDGSREASIGCTPQRYIWPAELDLMAQLAGFTLESRWADWDRSELTAASRSHVSVYRLSTLDR